MEVVHFLFDHEWLLWLSVIVGVALFAFRETERKAKLATKKLNQAMLSGLNEPNNLHPEIDPAKCAGCGACTRVCPEGDILKLIDNKAVLIAPSKCVGHGECERACPFGAIDLVFGTKTRGLDIPRLSKNYETNVPGLYIAGELGGMGLIRNAVKQGHLATSHAIKNLVPGIKTDTDVFVVGAGAAGLAASLTAVSKKRRYICIEQNSLGGTIYNFPRQKIVMTYPVDMPGFGQMKFSKNKISKEELLEYWNKVRKKAGVKILEHVKFEALEPKAGYFKIKTNKGEYSAQKVILCMGVRGSPRRLGLPGEDSEKVAYNLIDPEQYQKMHIAVVGGGNAGVEAAIMLSKKKYQNKVTLLVRSAVLDRCNDENKRILEERVARKKLEVWYESEVKEIKKDTLKVERAKKQVEIENNYLFIYAGAELPHKFLMSLGVSIDKAFGDRGLKAAK